MHEHLAARVRHRELAAPLVSWLQLLFRLNRSAGGLIPYRLFHNDAVSSLAAEDLMQDYRSWRQRGALIAERAPGTDFVYCEYPFLLTPDAKRRVLQLEARLAMSTTMLNSQMAVLLGASPFMLLQVFRGHIIDSTLSQLGSMHPSQLKKPLKVIFVGEEGVDEGGVTKEFFQLLVRELFDPK